jgi:hypothetical protein
MVHFKAFLLLQNGKYYHLNFKNVLETQGAHLLLNNLLSVTSSVGILNCSLNKLLIQLYAEKRPLWKPRRIQEDNIKMYLRDITWVVDWLHLSQRRHRWWDPVNTVTKFSVHKRRGTWLTIWKKLNLESEIISTAGIRLHFPKQNFLHSLPKEQKKVVLGLYAITQTFPTVLCPYYTTVSLKVITTFATIREDRINEKFVSKR